MHQPATTAPVPKQSETRFPRLKRILEDINNPEIMFSAILGAGISVSAGYSAFRSTNSVFEQMQHEYHNWPGKDTDEDDSFLQYAFSVRSVLNNPRVHYRVLRKFNDSTRGKIIYPTISHCFLMCLAEMGRLSRVVTQNVDRLEEAVGLRKLLGDNLIEAHGVFDGPGSCPNLLCPGASQIGECRYSDTIHEAVGELQAIYPSINEKPIKGEPRTEHVPAHDLKADNNAPMISRDGFMMAVLDDSVACCPFCGCGLKPSMVLYGEEVNIKADSLQTLFFESESLFIIGTSMNVFPISMLPLTVSPKVCLHFVAKEINFHRYLNENLIANEEVYTGIIEKRENQNKFRNSERIKAEVMDALNSNQENGSVLDAQLNELTPDFCFHKGESDALFCALLNHLPQMSNRVEEIYEHCKQEAEHSNIAKDLVVCGDIAKYDRIECEVVSVILEVPELFPPDAAIFEYENRFSMVCVCTMAQMELIHFWLKDFLECEKNSEENYIITDTRFNRMTPLLDEVVYKPIGGHWGVYCIGYNAYYIPSEVYIEDLDPWSANFAGYRGKDIFCEHADYFCYAGVTRNSILAQQLYKDNLKFYLKCTHRMLLDYSIVSYPAFTIK